MSDLQSEALPALLYLQQRQIKKVKFDYLSGRGQGIRTLGGVNLAGFQNRYNRPTLSTLYTYMVRMVRIELTLRNRNGILSPARLPIPPHSHIFLRTKFKLLLKMDWNYIKKIYLCQGF